MAVFAAQCIAHETPPEAPTTEDLAKVEPALTDSVPFARKFTTHLRNQLSAQQLQRVDEVSHELELMRQVQRGAPMTDRRLEFLEQAELADYHRWRAEQSLLRLLTDMDGIIELDFRRGPPRHGMDTPIALDPQHHLVVLKVITGDGPVGFSSQEWDLVSERIAAHFPVKIERAGTTYALLDLRQVPEQRTITHLAFHEALDGPPVYTYALTFQASPIGQLAIDVVDERGESTPVLLQVASRHAGKLWEPAEAVDLRSMLNDVVPHLGNIGRGYMFHLPGERRGRYWIVKPPLEMPLPVGEWDIRVLRGLEYTPIRKTISVTENEWTRVQLRPKRWTNMPALGWYAGDDHIHARLQTSEDARKLLDYTRAADIHIANILEMGDVMRTYYAQRGFGEEFRVQHGDHWLIPGQEDPRSVLGHAIGLNLQAKVRDVERYLDNRWLASEIHRQGGLYGHTHVGPNACFVHREMALFTPHGFVDFNSIMQAGLGLELYYNFLNMGFKMTATAGADTPYGGTIGAVRTYAFVGKDSMFTPDGWFTAVREGRTFTTNGPMLDFRVGDALPGAEIVVDRDQTIRATVKAWGDPGWSAPARLRLVKLGATLEEKVATDAEDTQLSLEAELHAGHGFWLAAHAIGHDGSEAHTTPVYVTRAGYRHWNVDVAKQLLEKQLATLDEIEGEIQLAEEAVSSNRNPLDYWNRRTAEQAVPLRRQIAATRAVYQQLIDQLASERLKRSKEPSTDHEG